MLKVNKKTDKNYLLVCIHIKKLCKKIVKKEKKVLEGNKEEKVEIKQIENNSKRKLSQIMSFEKTNKSKRKKKPSKNGTKNINKDK